MRSRRTTRLAVHDLRVKVCELTAARGEGHGQPAYHHVKRRRATMHEVQTRLCETL